ncbi:MAG: NUDIX domain-containing protein [Ilumatobacteraceae bacterium]
MAELRIRQAVRALLVTPEQAVLLVRFEFATATVWALPGGGLEPGEDHVTALRRELIEEVGLHDAAIGAHVWTREHVIPFEDGMWDGQRDVVHVVATEHFEPQPTLSWDQLRAERLHEIRWWTLDEIEAVSADPAATVVFAPRRLAELLRLLQRDGIPESPLASGI